MGLFEQDVFDESLEDLIEAPEVDADQYAGDEDDGGARDHLLLARPLDLLQLCPGLGHEAAAARAGDAARSAVRGLRGRLGHRSGHLPLSRRARRAVGCLRPAVAALLPGLSLHYRVSRWTV